ncbi:MAG: hypothetical protein EOO01_11055 [Chitinophagaceae bacterium]|nr:MAG: hypothetical protein EOO01_11055 [Chitinophagaceae bacterium]
MTAKVSFGIFLFCMLKYLLVNEWKLIPLSRAVNTQVSLYLVLPLMIIGFFISIYSLPHYFKRKKYWEVALTIPMIIYLLATFFVMIS